MTHGGHSIEYCVCGRILTQCRCASKDKTRTVREGPCRCNRPFRDPALHTTNDGRPPTPGYENAPAPAPIDPVTGQHERHWVLSAEERAQGFVRPVRRSYVHAGLGPVCGKAATHPPIGLEGTPHRWVCSDPLGHEGECSHWWMEETVARTRGCNVTTSMPQAIAETYAREPAYYGTTHCAHCKLYLPVGHFVWCDPDGTRTTQRVGT